jgi:LacI family transcriptional regulator
VAIAAEALGYEPNELARSLTRGATMMVGFVVRDIASPALPPTLFGAESVLRAKGYAMLVLDCEGRAELDRQHIGLLRRRRVDGLLLSIADEDDPRTHAMLLRLHIPFVAVDKELPPALGGSAVKIDFEHGLGVAANRLSELGHSRVAFIGGSQSIRPTKEALRLLGGVFGARRGSTLLSATGAFTTEHGLASTRRLLDQAEPPTAIVAGNTQILKGVLTALAERRLSIPASVSVLSIDDAPFLDFAMPPISVLMIDGNAVGRVAAELLLDRLAGGAPEVRYIQTDFQERQSLAVAQSLTPKRRARAALSVEH